MLRSARLALRVRCVLFGFGRIKVSVRGASRRLLTMFITPFGSAAARSEVFAACGKTSKGRKQDERDRCRRSACPGLKSGKSQTFITPKFARIRRKSRRWMRFPRIFFLSCPETALFGAQRSVSADARNGRNAIFTACSFVLRHLRKSIVTVRRKK